MQLSTWTRSSFQSMSYFYGQPGRSGTGAEAHAGEVLAVDKKVYRYAIGYYHNVALSRLQPKSPRKPTLYISGIPVTLESQLVK